MTIWRDVFIENNVDLPALAHSLASAFGVNTAQVAVVTTDEEWLTLPDGFEVVVETRPTCGEARLMATLFLFRDAAEVERVEDRAVVQDLADGLGCAVLLPDDADMDPFNYLRFRPSVPADRVSLDPEGLDERPTRVEVHGPAPPPRRSRHVVAARGSAGDPPVRKAAPCGADRARGDAKLTLRQRRKRDVPSVPLPQQ